MSCLPNSNDFKFESPIQISPFLLNNYKYEIIEKLISIRIIWEKEN